MRKLIEDRRPIVRNERQDFFSTAAASNMLFGGRLEGQKAEHLKYMCFIILYVHVFCCFIHRLDSVSICSPIRACSMRSSVDARANARGGIRVFVFENVNKTKAKHAGWKTRARARRRAGRETCLVFKAPTKPTRDTQCGKRVAQYPPSPAQMLTKRVCCALILEFNVCSYRGAWVNLSGKIVAHQMEPTIYENK